jgi:hypothetical protein
MQDILRLSAAILKKEKLNTQAALYCICARANHVACTTDAPRRQHGSYAVLLANQCAPRQLSTQTHLPSKYTLPSYIHVFQFCNSCNRNPRKLNRGTRIFYTALLLSPDILFKHFVVKSLIIRKQFSVTAVWVENQITCSQLYKRCQTPILLLN